MGTINNIEAGSKGFAKGIAEGSKELFFGARNSGKGVWGWTKSLANVATKPFKMGGEFMGNHPTMSKYIVGISAAYGAVKAGQHLMHQGKVPDNMSPAVVQLSEMNRANEGLQNTMVELTAQDNPYSRFAVNSPVYEGRMQGQQMAVGYGR